MSENKNRTISVVYILCAIVCAIRGLLNLTGGRRDVGILLFVMGLIFLVLGILYRRKG